MGIGKHGMSLAESRAAADSIEWSPSKTAGSSHIATSGQAKHAAHPMAKAKSKRATEGMHHGKHAMPFQPKGGGGGHHKNREK